MKRFLINALEAVAILFVFVVFFGMIYAAAFILDDGFGAYAPAWIAITVGFFFFVIVIANVIESVCD